ncbi:MAG: RimK family alpha-L-glutamate ligase [Novosphingobium sp.]
MKIAFLACPDTLPGSPTRRPDAFEHDLLLAALREGCGARAEVIDIDWRAPLEELARFDVAYLGTPWNYTEAKDEFLARLDALQGADVGVCNDPAVIRWNSDKLYLKELEARSCPSIPTLWPEAPTPADIRGAFEHFGCDRVVVKRRVGAGAIGQDSFRRGDPAIDTWRMDQPAMIQPFLPAIQSEGELSFIFIGGALSHALVKRAAAGDYRIQSLYGGSEVPLEPTHADRKAAEAVMAALPFAEAPTYARIDMVRLESGQLAVIEAELIEPYLYPEQGPEFGGRLADALLQRSNI